MTVPHEQEWRATVGFSRPAGGFSERTAEQLVEALPGFGLVLHDERLVRLAFSVEATTLNNAVGAAHSTACAVWRRVMGHAARPVDMRIMSTEEMEYAAKRPRVDEVLIGVAEAAQILGVSPPRVGQLASTHEDFPPPVGNPGMGPIYTKRSVEEFARRRSRLPGRRAS